MLKDMCATVMYAPGANLPIMENKDFYAHYQFRSIDGKTCLWILLVGLPDSEGYDAVWNVACRLTKMRHLIPCHSIITVHGLAKLFVLHVFRLHGLPQKITSDRGTEKRY